jgi:hypothetical protein
VTTQELVERLRIYQAYCPQTDRSDHPICTEAADRLSEMDAEIKRLRDKFTLLMNRPEIIGASISGLRDFARAALEHQQKGDAT